MFKKRNHLPPTATFKEVWSEGDTITKYSFFIMGLNALKRSQWAKGLSLLLSEIVFFAQVGLTGFSSIRTLSNLRLIKKKQVIYDTGQDVYVTKQPDSSVLILLSDLLALVVVMDFTRLYVINLHSVRKNYVLKHDY